MFMEAAQHNSDAWSGTLAFVNYRSALNAQMAPRIPNLTRSHEADFRVSFKAARLSASSGGVIGAFYDHDAEMVPGSEAALFVERGQEGKVVWAPKELVIEGAGYNIFLDGYHLKNVIVRDAKITYEGGDLILENVYFVNCTFDVKRIPQGQQFAGAALSHGPVNFTPSTHS